MDFTSILGGRALITTLLILLSHHINHGFITVYSLIGDLFGRGGRWRPAPPTRVRTYVFRMHRPQQVIPVRKVETKVVFGVLVVHVVVLDVVDGARRDSYHQPCKL